MFSNNQWYTANTNYLPVFRDRKAAGVTGIDPGHCSHIVLPGGRECLASLFTVLGRHNLVLLTQPVNSQTHPVPSLEIGRRLEPETNTGRRTC